MEHINKYQRALFQTRDGEFIRCGLCPHACKLSEGQSGLCGVRSVINNELVSKVYALPSALQIDPIEKKPLYHFLPGSKTFSIGTQGCNLQCKFCQNWHLSRQLGHVTTRVKAEEIVTRALAADCQSIAFTYNEPIIFAEYAIEIRDKAKKAGLPCIFVSNGYITPEAREMVFEDIAAVNIDLKAFSDELYREYTGGSLAPVLDTIEWCVKKGIHTEITSLIIPGVNDDHDMIEKECRWIVKQCGNNVPLHLSAFHPDYKMLDYPRTSRNTLERCKDIALESGIRYIYIGNYPGVTNNTVCPVCGETVIDRNGFNIRVSMDHQHELPIIWSVS